MLKLNFFGGKFRVSPGGGHGGHPHSHLKMKAPQLKNKPPHCLLLIKQHWKKMAEIPQKRDFLTWSIQNFIRKVKQFVGKYCIDLT